MAKDNRQELAERIAEVLDKHGDKPGDLELQKLRLDQKALAAAEAGILKDGTAKDLKEFQKLQEDLAEKIASLEPFGSRLAAATTAEQLELLEKELSQSEDRILKDGTARQLKALQDLRKKLDAAKDEVKKGTRKTTAPPADKNANAENKLSKIEKELAAVQAKLAELGKAPAWAKSLEKEIQAIKDSAKKSEEAVSKGIRDVAAGTDLLLGRVVTSNLGQSVPYAWQPVGFYGGGATEAWRCPYTGGGGATEAWRCPYTGGGGATEAWRCPYTGGGGATEAWRCPYTGGGGGTEPWRCRW